MSGSHHRSEREPTTDYPLPRRSSRPPAPGAQADEAATTAQPAQADPPDASGGATSTEGAQNPAAGTPAGAEADAGSTQAGAPEAAPADRLEDEAAWLGWGGGPMGTPFGMFHRPPTEPIEAYGGSGEEHAEPVDRERVKDEVLQVLRTVYDPEIPVNIVELGLIYSVEVSLRGKVEIEMTLTAPGCPVAGQLVEEVARKAGEVPGVSVSHVKLVWEPPWTPERMSEAARLELGFF